MKKEFLGILVFVVDGAYESRHLIGDWMEEAGFRVSLFQDGWSAIRGLAASPDVVIVNQGAVWNGLQDISKALRRSDKTIPLVVLGEAGSEDKASAALAEGAFDYLVRPLDRLRLILSVRHAAESRWLKVTIRDLERELHQRDVRDSLENDQREPFNIRELEKQAIARALRATRGNVSKAARDLGLGRTTLYRKMTAYGLSGAKSPKGEPTILSFVEERAGE